ncbi:MAG: hypothetical protein H0W39_07650 [Sphingomonas sp.]|nr:hypothetical protein [Sphingomonas sp.]
MAGKIYYIACTPGGLSASPASTRTMREHVGHLPDDLAALVEENIYG